MQIFKNFKCQILNFNFIMIYVIKKDSVSMNHLNYINYLKDNVFKHFFEGKKKFSIFWKFFRSKKSVVQDI